MKKLEDLMWLNRILILSYQDDEDSNVHSINKFKKKEILNLNERNIKILTFKRSKNKNFETPTFIKNKTGFWIVGYDGLVKDYSKDSTILTRIFDLIDSMPMRVLDSSINQKL
mgnify:CR=1 FL=1